jgi:ketosteroid isomerase-like protein
MCRSPAIALNNFRPGAPISSEAALSRTIISDAMILSPNKQTIQTYMHAFARSDHAEVLSCLTEDVEWIVPGAFHIKGKDAFDNEIENDAFIGSPKISVTRLVEEDDIVVAEGIVQSAKKDGGMLNAVFCDVFVMDNAKIRRLTSYLMDLGAT